MPVKQTMWLFVKALIIGGLISLALAYMGDEPANNLTITQHFTSMAFMVFW